MAFQIESRAKVVVAEALGQWPGPRGLVAMFTGVTEMLVAISFGRSGRVTKAADDDLR